MSEISRTIDILDVNGCAIRDENGSVLAILREEDNVVVVERQSACTIGMYFYILSYLIELGFDVQ